MDICHMSALLSVNTEEGFILVSHVDCCHLSPRGTPGMCHLATGQEFRHEYKGVQIGCMALQYHSYSDCHCECGI